MLENLYKRRFDSPLPQLLYDLTRDMFAIVQYWDPFPISGPEKGRLFERILYRYCGLKGISLTERAGSRTVRGTRAASGFGHESDAVVATPELTIHIELKHLTDELGKNELLVFNQKGLDFLMADSASLRSKPFYRFLLSGSLLSREARHFALLWGIHIIEPDRLPLLLIHELAGHKVEGLRGVESHNEKEIWEQVPNLVVPLQQRITRFARVLEAGGLVLGDHRVERALYILQRRWGDEYWIALDSVSGPNWLEEQFELLSDELALEDAYPFS